MHIDDCGNEIILFFVISLAGFGEQIIAFFSLEIWVDGYKIANWGWGKT